MTRVKICGITSIRDAGLAVDLGAHALGFVFYSKSKRFIEPGDAADIIKELPPFVYTVGVFVNPGLDELDEVVGATGIHTVQLHGDETPKFCHEVSGEVIKALRVDSTFDTGIVDLYPGQAILFDNYSKEFYGGTGESFNWDLLGELNTPKRIILSGGLGPENVLDAIKTINPYAVDVSSGVEESPGKKDESKLVEFFKAVRNGDKNAET